MLRPTRHTVASRDSNSRAIALPMPLEAPVIKIFWPEKRSTRRPYHGSDRRAVWVGCASEFAGFASQLRASRLGSFEGASESVGFATRSSPSCRSNCNKCTLEHECKKRLIAEANERRLPLSYEEMQLSPSELAQRIFESLISGDLNELA